MSKSRKRKPAKQQSKPNNTHTLRIIAGQWRGRKLSFASAPGLRPTPDRVRETLFNWLQGHLYKANCLDLFAGSGALSFEALSRGAEHVTLIENNLMAVEMLATHIELLSISNIDLVQSDAFQFLENCSSSFELIFLDPPFRKNYLPTLLTLIKERRLLSTNGLIYLEHEKEQDLTDCLSSFKVLKKKKVGQVVSLLVKYE